MATDLGSVQATEAANHIPVEVDSEFSDADSSFGDGQSETQSITSSILAHREENGRRYHSYKDGKYLGPNDDQEGDRLDILHHIHLLQLGGALHMAPLPKDFVGQVLDLGAGTGIWATDMGDAYPSATITGVDLSPTQSDWVPPNVWFEVDDVEEDWTYTKKFDYIHCKFLSAAVRDWPRLVRQCYDNLVPGGWMEFCEWDYSPRHPNGDVVTGDNWVTKWHSLVMDTCEERTGADTRPGPKLKDWVTRQGFEEIRHVALQVPVGSWPKDPRLKEVGRYYRFSLEDGLDSITLRIFTQLLGYDIMEARATNAYFRTAMREINFYHVIHVVTCRKPFAK